jgi:hypothetical protein
MGKVDDLENPEDGQPHGGKQIDPMRMPLIMSHDVKHCLRKTRVSIRRACDLGLATKRG